MKRTRMDQNRNVVGGASFTVLNRDDDMTEEMPQLDARESEENEPIVLEMESEPEVEDEPKAAEKMPKENKDTGFSRLFGRKKPEVEKPEPVEKPVRVEPEDSDIVRQAAVVPPKPLSMTVIAQDVEVVGDVQTSGSIHVMGKVTGNITAQGDITVSGEVSGDLQAESIAVDGGTVSAERIIANRGIVIRENSVISSNIECDTIEVSGEVTGNISANTICTLKEIAEVYGDISTQMIEIQTGAVFNGKLSAVARELLYRERA